MKWSWKVGRIGGVDLRVHATFLLLLVWLALSAYRTGGTLAAVGQAVAFILALFASVVLHELGHSRAARRFGVPTKDITLLPIGGVAKLEYIPDKPKQELVIALAGPAVTLSIIVVLYVAIRLLGLPVALGEEVFRAGNGGSFLARLLWVNVSLLLFNLLPAFPMDGGRVLRSVLALRMPYLRATEVASRVARAFAVLFGVVGFLYNPFLMIIAFFVWLGAAGESAALQQRSILGGVTVERVMVRDVQTLAPGDTLDAALRHVLAGFQHDFPVVEQGAVVGVLTRDALLRGLAARGRESTVAAAMEASFRTADPREPVEGALAHLRECRCQTLPVLAGGALVGVVTTENVAEFVMIEAALRSPPRAKAA